MDDDAVEAPESFDYDYTVESFYYEYKIDKKKIKSLINQYYGTEDRAEQIELLSEFKRLYPEYNTTDLRSVDVDALPNVVSKKAYFIQSPKGDDGLPTIHYSLKEKMLSDFRAKRSVVKKQQAQAEHSGDTINAIRYNAKQLAIKVVCNSEYGASNNSHFAHYDPDIAAAVTYAARQLIGFLTCNLETDLFYIDDKFYKQNEKEINNLAAIKALSVNEYTGPRSELYAKRRHVLRTIFDDFYNVIADKIYEVHIHKSTVVYQDTDSNYYNNQYITDYFTQGKDDIRHCSPEIIDECMHRMLDHNNMMANFVKEGVKRRPVSLGFEGSFIICRYLNRKKRYYGIQWSPDGEAIPAVTINPLAYKDNVLIPDYDKYWIPKKSVLPRSNGEYIYLDTDLLLHKGVNYLDYVHDYKVKCTGIDLVRRDQYKFINYFHIMILQKDLRLMKYEGDNKWSMFNRDEPIQVVIEDIMKVFREIVLDYNNIAELKTDKKPAIEFQITDFAKNAAYRKDKRNAVSTIVLRLMAQHKEQYIPKIGDRMMYIVILDDKTKSLRDSGKDAVEHVADRSYAIDEILDEVKAEYPPEKFSTTLNLTYDEWLNAKIISMLDYRYYFECLCKSTALYLIGEWYPEEAKRIDEGLMSQTESNNLVTKLQGAIASMYVKQYFHYGKAVTSAINKVERNVKSYMTKLPTGIDLLYKVYKDLKGPESFTLTVKNQIIADAKKNIDKLESCISTMNKIYKTISTNEFIGYIPKTNTEKLIFNKFENDLPGLLSQIELCSKKLALYNQIDAVAREMKFSNETAL